MLHSEGIPARLHSIYCTILARSLVTFTSIIRIRIIWPAMIFYSPFWNWHPIMMPGTSAVCVAAWLDNFFILRFGGLSTGRAYGIHVGLNKFYFRPLRVEHILVENLLMDILCAQQHWQAPYYGEMQWSKTLPLVSDPPTAPSPARR